MYLFLYNNLCLVFSKQRSKSFVAFIKWLERYENRVNFKFMSKGSKILYRQFLRGFNAKILRKTNVYYFQGV